MKDNFVHQDERVLEERRKIQSRGYSLLVWGLIISLLIQQIMQVPFSQVAAEFWLLIGCGIYQMVANVRRGFNIWDTPSQSKGRLLGSAVIAGLVAVLVISLMSRGKDWTGMAVFLVIYIPMFYGLRILLIHISHKRQEKLERDLDSEENKE